MKLVAQFMKNYEHNTKESYILIAPIDNQQRSLSLNIDVVRITYELLVVAMPYMDLRNLSQKLQGIATDDQHKHKGGISFTNVMPTL